MNRERRYEIEPANSDVISIPDIGFVNTELAALAWENFIKRQALNWSGKEAKDQLFADLHKYAGKLPESQKLPFQSKDIQTSTAELRQFIATDHPTPKESTLYKELFPKKPSATPEIKLRKHEINLDEYGGYQKDWKTIYIKDRDETTAFVAGKIDELGTKIRKKTAIAEIIIEHIAEQASPSDKDTKTIIKYLDILKDAAKQTDSARIKLSIFMGQESKPKNDAGDEYNEHWNKLERLRDDTKKFLHKAETKIERVTQKLEKLLQNMDEKERQKIESEAEALFQRQLTARTDKI